MDVVSEIKQLKARDVLFIDLNLIADVDYAKRLFKALAPLKIRWGGLTTVQIGWDDELLDLCAKSGCKGLLMGFESLSRENLLLTSKAFNLVKDYKDVIKRLHEKGVRIMGCFVFGLDDDDKTVFKRTVDFCIDAKIDLPRFAIVTPFPNTPLYNRLKAEGRVLTEDWSLYDAQHVVFQPKHMTAEELYRGTEWAWKRVYSYSAIFRRLSGTKWPFIESLKYALPANLGYRFYSRRLSKFYTCGAVNPARL